MSDINNTNAANPQPNNNPQGPFDGLNQEKPKLDQLIKDMTDFQKEMFTSLIENLDILGDYFESEKQKKESEGIQDVVKDLVGKTSPSFSFNLPGNKAKENPVKSDLLSNLPIEFSMGYIYLGNKLDKIYETLSGKKSDKKNEDDGGFLSGLGKLLSGAGALGALAFALLLFAVALVIFQFVRWDAALVGAISFVVFVTIMVFVASRLNEHMENFKQFAKGVVYIVAGLILFGVACYISALVEPYLQKALLVIGSFLIFIGLMTLISLIVQQNIESYQKFAIGNLILIGALVLFSFAIVITALLSPFLGEALPVVGLFIGFVLGMSVAARIVGSNLPYFIVFGIGVIVLTIALVAFNLALKTFEPIFNYLGPAIVGLGLLLVFFGIVAIVSAFVGPLIPLIIVFTIGSIALSIGLIVFGAVISILGDVSKKVPAALLTLNGILLMLNKISDLGLGFLLILPILLGFTVASVSLAISFLLFGAALDILEKTHSKTILAMFTLNVIIGLLRRVSDSGEEAKQALEPSWNLMLISLRILVIAKSMKESFETLNAVAEIVPQALKSLSQIMSFFVGDPSIPGSEERSFLNLLNRITTKKGDQSVTQKLFEFSLALMPFSKSIELMGLLMKELSSIEPYSKSAVSVIKDIMSVLIGDPKDPESVSLFKAIQVVVGTGTAFYIGPIAIGPRGILDSIDDFSSGLIKLTQGLQTLVEGVITPLAANTSTAQQAVNTVGLIMSLLLDPENGMYQIINAMTKENVFANFFQGDLEGSLTRFKRFGEGLSTFSEGLANLASIPGSSAELNQKMNTIRSILNTHFFGEQGLFKIVSNLNLNIDTNKINTFFSVVQALGSVTKVFSDLPEDEPFNDRFTKNEVKVIALTNNLTRILNFFKEVSNNAYNEGRVKTFLSFVENELGRGIDSLNRVPSIREASLSQRENQQSGQQSENNKIIEKIDTIIDLMRNEGVKINLSSESVQAIQSRANGFNY